MKYKTSIAIFVLLALVGLLQAAVQAKDSKKGSVLAVAGQTIQIEIADSEAERIKGLSGRNGLREGSGLWFVPEGSGKHGIWMKDMRFSLDVIWFDADLRVVDIESDVSPSTYPRVFYPDTEARYVLELRAGEALRLGIRIGDQAEFEKQVSK